MDVARTSFVLTIAALHAAIAFAARPSPAAPVARTANYAGQSDWPTTGPTTAPTISASPNNRYAYPQNTQPAAVGQSQSITNRAQNAFSETANTLRDGFDSGIRATGQQLQSTGNSIRSGAQQTLGTSGYAAQSTNPFAPATAATTNPTARGSVTAPPWPTTTSAPTNTTAPSWSNSLTPATPIDRSVLTNPIPAQPNSGWSAIGTSIASPPLLIPQLPASNTSFAPISTTPVDSGPSFTTDSYRGQQSNQNPSGYTSPPSTTSGAVRSASSAADSGFGWDNNPNNSPASMSRNANNSSLTSPGRDSSFAPSQPVAANPQDPGRTSTGRSTDSWNDNSWNQNSLPPGGPAASIGSSRPAVIGSANNSALGTQPPANSPTLGPPMNGSAASNFPPIGATSNATQPPIMSTASKPVQAGTSPTGEPQTWVTYVFIVLSLVGSLAGNLYLGWSYLDARQKYQALVRRTAETFRRTKPVAA